MRRERGRGGVQSERESERESERGRVKSERGKWMGRAAKVIETVRVEGCKVTGKGES